MDLVEAVLDPASATRFERLVRALLAAAADFGEFDATYLTTIDWARHEQLVRFSCNVGSLEVAEGHRIGCPPELDEQLFLGVTRSDGLSTPMSDGHVARGLGLATYVSVPVLTLSHRLYGTLCGASRRPAPVDNSTISAMECFASLLSDYLARDATAHADRRAAAAERLLADGAQFMAESEHKLKTHLAVIAGWATTLAEVGPRLSPAERDNGIEAIRGQADELGLALQRMLEQAKAEIKPAALEPVDIDLVAFVQASAKTLRGAAPHHAIECSDTAPIHAAADPAVLHQVLAHLTDNAVKYSPPGSTVRVSVGRYGPWAVIEVEDEGMGLPESLNVFAAFERGADQAVRATHGVGLGLHIVRSLVQAMGGAVSARRNPDVGSTFTVLLPAAEAALEAARTAPGL
jgi:signal transduction histidine kinase